MAYKIGLLHTGIREDERMIIQKARADKEVEIENLDLRKMILDFNLKEKYQKFDLILQRCAAGGKADQAIWYFNEIEVPIINDLDSSMLCKNKFATNLRLKRFNLPVPDFFCAFSEKEVLEGIKEIGGYPVVIKPIAGTSWGRLMGKLNDKDGVEMILEHKNALGVNHQSFYIQKFVEKPDRDIRAYLIGDQIVTAVYRETEHWVTNTARGAKLKECEVTSEMKKLGPQIQKAIGSGLFAIDFFETEKGLVINEINHTMEFKNVVKKTEVDLAQMILDYCKTIIDR
jgi:[lysine-biosynthesis-protein LysW]--L-2-aminoadipate ligase